MWLENIVYVVYEMWSSPVFWHSPYEVTSWVIGGFNELYCDYDYYYYYYYYYKIIYLSLSLLTTRICQKITGFNSTCHQREVKDYLAALRVTYGYHFNPWPLLLLLLLLLFILLLLLLLLLLCKLNYRRISMWLLKEQINRRPHI